MKAVLNGPFGQVDLGPNPLTIGRTPGNQLVLAEPKVSSHHAEIRPQGQDYAIVDLGSTNGTFVNDQRLTSNVPNVLRAGDTIVIGDTRFTYEVTGMSASDPTVYAGSRQGNDPPYTPTVAAPVPPYTGYGADAQQPGAYQPPPPSVSPGYEQASYPQASPYYGAPVSGYGADAQPGAYQPPPPPPAYVGSQPSGYPQGASYPGAPAPVVPPAQRPNRRGLWIILGAIGGLVVIAIILFAVIGYVNRSTPTKTLNAFCTALKGGDYQTAFNQLDSGLQSKLGPEGTFAAGYASNGGLGKITDCTVTNVDDGAGTGTINYTLGQGNRLVVDYKLADENGSSKITSQQPRSTPTLTLTTFCNALKGGDYQTAYNQYSSAIQSQETEAQFAEFGAILSSNKVTSCTLSNVNDTAGTGTVSYTVANGGSLVGDYTLVNENNTWKIKTEQLHSAPALTLANFCYALKTGDYQTAYNQLSSRQQSLGSEAQFAASISSNMVTACTLSNVNDTAGTGTISYTFAQGNTSVIAYTLIMENGTWKIDSGQQTA